MIDRRQHMDLTSYIKQPAKLDGETLYELRSMLALYPYFQTARLLMLQNLYLLHDSSFDEELRKTALYATDRKAIFNMVESAHYQIRQAQTVDNDNKNKENRTVALIDSFLDSIPVEEDKETEKRKPTPADAANDYVSYLIATEKEANNNDGPQLKGQDLIDNFLEQEQGRIMLNDLSMAVAEEPEAHVEVHNIVDDNVNDEEEYFTETLARIYIKQGRYQKALEIIERLNEKFPHKNAYFADQIRFLEKLIINNNNNNKIKK